MAERSLDRHPTDTDLRSFLRAEDEPALNQRMRQHLETGCVWCLRRMQSQARGAGEAEREELRPSLRGAETEASGLNRVLERAERRIFLLEAERAAAPELLRELLQVGGAEERKVAIRTEGRFRFFALADLLIEESRREGFEDISRAGELAELAVDVADTLDRRAYPPGLVADTLARSWGALANNHRIRTRLVEAGRAIRIARGLLAHGSQDPRVRAEVLSLHGSLLTTEARYAEAIAVLQEAAEIYRTYDAPAEQGKLLIQLGNAAGEAGDPERAAVLLEAARQRLVEQGSGEVSWMAAQAQMWWLVVAERPAEARAVLEELEEATRGQKLSFFLEQRIAWAGARLLWAEGDLEGAENRLRVVEDGYRERDQVYRTCLLMLDRAMLLLERGRPAEVRRLAEAMLPAFASRQLHHNVVQALVVFQQAAAAETLSLALLEDLARFLRRAAGNPFLSYTPDTET
jgi:tetratricopeptide (TPR) repeat protein